MPKQTTEKVIARTEKKVTKQDTGYAEKAYKKPLSSYNDKDGNPLPAKIPYDFKWDEWKDEEVMIDAGDGLTPKEQWKVRCSDSKITARQAANAALLTALGIVQPNEMTDSYIRLKKVYDGLMGKRLANMPADLTEEQQKEYRDRMHIECRQKASDALEEPWPDEDDE